jgi:hypothetical protein
MSAVTAKFKVQYPVWQDAFDYWREVCGLDIIEAWRRQGKLIAERLIGGIGGGSNWNRATPPGTRKQGEEAMARDIRRAIFPLKAEGFRDVKVAKRVRNLVAGGNVQDLQAMVSAGAFGAENAGLKVIPAGNEFTAHQASRRTRGRVPEKSRNFAVPGDAYLKAYIRESKGAVGQGKGGWAASLLELGGTCPNWIARHVRAGTFINNLKRGAERVGFSLINRSKWARGGDEDRIIDKVMSDRAEAIKKDIEFLLANNWKRNARGRAM